LGLEQIILKCLWRLTILQLPQIFFTDDLIFIKYFYTTPPKTQQNKKQGKNPYFSIYLLFKNTAHYNTPLLK
jgi:hypothetical protein